MLREWKKIVPEIMVHEKNARQEDIRNDWLTKGVYNEAGKGHWDQSLKLMNMTNAVRTVKMDIDISFATRPNELLCLQNISDVWVIPVVSKELLDFVPDVVNRKLLSIKDFDVGWVRVDSILKDRLQALSGFSLNLRGLPIYLFSRLS